ncbi:MAG: DEAD/DEAH box helicase [Actinomycetota bacterium]|nr:DEAD/DEAH box helicase [Actinomycetota bacterium]
MSDPWRAQAGDRSVNSFQVRGAEWLREVSDADIEAYVGDKAFERALGYVDAERVISINTGDQGRMLLGVIGGSRDHDYTTLVTRTADIGPTPRWTSRCSCPMQARCKHVATLLIVARESLGGMVEIDRSVLWRQFVAQYADQPSKTTRRLGLRMVPTTAPSTRYDSTPSRRIAIVPTYMGKTSRWVKEAAWHDVLHDNPQRPWESDQHDAVIALYRLADAGLLPNELYLDQFAATMWAALARASDAGVAVMQAYGVSSNLDLAPWPVTPQLDMAEDDDELVLRALLPGLPVGERILIGEPAHGVAIIERGGAMTLAGFTAPARPAMDQLLRWGQLRVPAADAAEFRFEALPRLVERGALPKLPGPEAEREPLRLQLRVDSPAEHEIRIRAGFRYADSRVHPVALGWAATGRDRGSERELVQRLEPLLRTAGLLEPIGGLGWWPRAEHVLTGWAAVRAVEQVPEWSEHEDLHVVVEGELPAYEQVTDAPLIEIGTSDGVDPDWFDLRITVTIGGEEVPFEPLFAALVRGDEGMLLESGTWFTLDDPSLHRLRTLIEEMRGLVDRDPGASLSVNRFHVGLYDELVALGVPGEQSTRWSTAVGKLRDVENIEPPELPIGLQATLRPYQREGFSWLSTLWECDLGGVLADDMGLGKTVQALAMLARAHEMGELTEPVLVVAPSSVVGTWVSEAAKFAPDIPVVALPQTSRKRGRPLAESIGDAKIVVTSYAVLRLDADAFREHSWRGLILDEAQWVKNHRSKTFQAAKRIGAPFTLAITGTPLENSLMDLWSMFALAAPGLYPDPEVFSQRYRRPIESGREPELLDQLRRRIKPLMLRRTKEAVASDLPAKQIQLLHVEPSARHEATYRRHLQRERARILGLLEDADTNRVAILASLTKLRQLALDPRLVDDSYPAGEQSAKLTVLTEHLRELHEEGHRALVFSQFTSYLGLARDALDAAGVTTSYLDGSTRNRQQVIDGFKAGDQTAFLISLKAGGVGLTLTEADYVYLLDPWWNPATEAQAIDRVHRIGQERPVTVYRMVSQGTVEEKVVALQDRKRDLFTSVMDTGGAMSGAVTAADIASLLE